MEDNICCSITVRNNAEKLTRNHTRFEFVKTTSIEKAFNVSSVTAPVAADISIALIILADKTVKRSV